jgi:glycine reductase
MNLTLGKIKISNVKFGEKTEIKKGVLVIKKGELLAMARGNDKRLDRLDLIKADIAKPGDKTRIMPIKDIIEPRVKIEGKIGCGRTNALKRVSVITCGQIVGFQEGLLDMSGPGAKYSSFSKLINIVLTAKPVNNLPKHQHEEALRLLGLRAARYLAESGKETKPDEIENFELLSGAKKQASSLPRVVYIYMVLSQGLLHDTYVHGQDAKKMQPALIQPTEIMDGAIVSGNCVSACDKNTTYHHQNNSIIKELYKQHGKEINFVGVVIANVNDNLADKQRSTDCVIDIVKNLRPNGVIISKEGFGNPDADLMMICSKIKKLGAKTVCLTDEFAGSDGASQSLTDTHPSANAIISTGNANQLIALPPMEKIIGDLKVIRNLTGGYSKSLKSDGSLEIELQSIIGATNQLGFEKLSAREV